jgi:predicted LPLAT superfamily acyltransferase
MAEKTPMRRLGSISFPIDHPALPGHFPGRPLVPGALLLDAVLTIVVAAVSGTALAGLARVKFLAPVLPGQELEVRCGEPTSGRVGFVCRREGATAIEGIAVLCAPMNRESVHAASGLHRAVASRHWARQRERGSLTLLRLMVWIAFHIGQPVARTLLVGIAGYFFATSAASRAASQEFLTRARGRPAGAADVFRHIHAFAATLLESVLMIGGRANRFRIGIEGLDSLTAALAEGRGCVLLGAHYGSFEVLRSIARHAPVPVHPVMFRRGTGRLASVLEALDPATAAAVIDLGAPAAMLRVREAVLRGEIVGMLADRSLGERTCIEADFLGAAAAFPAGPFILAASVDAPVLLFWGIRTGPCQYTVRFEPFAHRIALPRSTRAADLQRWVGRYVASLEARCRADPFNWFNFYPFWGPR